MISASILVEHLGVVSTLTDPLKAFSKALMVSILLRP